MADISQVFYILVGRDYVKFNENAEKNGANIQPS